MKIFSLTVVVLLVGVVKAQSVVPFTVQQPPKFTVNAGDDVGFVPGLTLQATATGGSGSYTYQWTPALFLSDPNSATPVVSEPGSSVDFTLQVTDTGLGCTLTDVVHVDLTTGLSEVGSPVVVIQPNPAQDHVRVRSQVPIQRTRLYSPSGSLLQEQPGRSALETVIKITAYEATVLFLAVDLMDGRTLTRKLCTIRVY